MIQGTGVSTSVSFTHRSYRERQAETREKLATIRHRNAICKKHQITRAEYLRRLGHWQELRQIVTAERQRQQRREDVEAVKAWMMQKEKARISHRTKALETRVLHKAQVDFERLSRAR